MVSTSQHRTVNAGGFLGIVNTGDVRGDLNATVKVNLTGRRTVRPRLPPEDDLPGEKEVIKLLSWQTAISPLVGRAREMEELRNWALSGSGIRVRLLSGAGGSGKSRLAFELARELLSTQQWSTGFIQADEDADVEMDNRALLIAIDYAEQYLLHVLRFLDQLTRLEPAKSVRIILLSRHSVDWWRRNIESPSVYAILDSQECELSRLSDHDALMCFGNVTKTLAKHLGRESPVVEPNEIIDWINRNKELNALPLLVTAAGIQAILQPERALELSGQGILSALAGRERIRIDLIGNALGFKTGWASRLTALGILSGGITVPMARVLAENEPSLGLPPPEKIEDAICQLPSWDGDHLQEVTPDLVGAQLLIDTLAADPYHGPRWLIAVVRYGGELAERLARIAYDVRMTAGGPDNALTLALTKAVQADRAAAELITTTMRNLRPPDLLPALLAASKNLIDATSEGTATRARLLDRYSVQLNDAGEFDQALTICEQATRLAEKLKGEDPTFDLNILANCLHNRSNFRARRREFTDALSDIEGAVAIRRKLAEVARSRYLPDLASSLQNLGLHRAATGDSAGGDEAINEALDFYRDLALKDHDKHAREVARAMENYASRLQESGNRRAAVAASREAVSRRRELAKASPSQYENDLALSLQNLADRLGEIGDYDDAIEAIENALKLREHLAKVHSKRIAVDLLYSYQRLSDFQFESGRLAAALQTAERAVKRARTLSIQMPEVVEASLGLCLLTLAWRQINNGDFGSARAAADEATRLIEPRARRDPARFEQDVASCLQLLARCLRESGDIGSALELLSRAVVIRRSLVQANPIRYGAQLANSLRQMSWFLSTAGEWQEAYEVALEAVDLCRRLTSRLPLRFDPELATSLIELQRRCVDTGQYADAIAYATEAVNLCEKYAESEPDRFRPLLASALTAYAERLSDVCEFRKALSASERAMALYDSLPERVRPRYGSERINCARSLAGLRFATDDIEGGSKVLSELESVQRALPRSSSSDASLALLLTAASSLRDRAGQRAASVRDAREGLLLRRRLAQSDAQRFNSEFCDTLQRLSYSEATAGLSKAALSSIEECIRVRTPLYTGDVKRFRRDLAYDLWALSARLADAGKITKALNIMERAVGHFRELVEVCPERFSAELGRALLSLGSHRAKLNGWKAAISDTAVGLRLVRSAARRDPLRYLVPFASGLRSAASLRARGKQMTKATTLVRRAARVCAEVTDANTFAGFLHERARALVDLSKYRRATGDLAGAVHDAETAVDIWCDLARRAPSQFEPELAFGLQMLAACHSDGRNVAAASVARNRALTLSRSLMAVDAVAFGPGVAANLVAAANDSVDPARALIGMKEAIGILQRCAPESFVAEHDLPWALTRRAHVFERLGIIVRAIAELRRSVELDERLLLDNPERVVYRLVSSLVRLSQLYRDSGRIKQAMIAIARARLLSHQFPRHFSIAQIAEIDEFDCDASSIMERWRARASGIWSSATGYLSLIAKARSAEKT